MEEKTMTTTKSAVAKKKVQAKGLNHLELAADACKIYLAKIGSAGKDLDSYGSSHRRTVRDIPLASASGVWAAALRKGAQGPGSRLMLSVVPHGKTQQGLLNKVKEAVKDLPCSVDLCRAGTIQTILAYKDRNKVIPVIARTVKTYKV